MNKELNDFQRSITSMGEFVTSFRIANTQMRKFVQAMSQQMDRV